MRNHPSEIESVLEVETFGAPVLRGVSRAIDAITPEIREFADGMVASMAENNGIGLAAPQVGRNIRLITLATVTPGEELSPLASPGERFLCPRMPVALVNPEITGHSEQESGYIEGCLSIPGIDGEVVRPIAVRVRARLLDGQTIELECAGLLARCIQHEIDHLNGVLFVDRLGDADRKALAQRLKSMEKQTLKRMRRRGRRP